MVQCCTYLLVIVASATAFIPESRSRHPSANRKPMSHRSPFHDSSSKVFMSDVPRDDIKDDDDERPILEKFKGFLPPPPEDQWMITGDVGVLFVYAFASHYFNNFIVQSVFGTSDSVEDAVRTLDPWGDIVQLQVPVWVDCNTAPHISNQVQSIMAQQSLLNHWGPLFSTAGAACVALCSCWLMAGWFHRTFLYQNTVDCDTSDVLQKTVETWVSSAGLLLTLAISCHALVGQVPVLQHMLGYAQSFSHDVILTKADMFYIVDSLTVLLCWRFMVRVMMGYLGR